MNAFTYAGLWRRFLALVIDFLLFCVVFFPVTKLVKGVWIMSASDHRWHNGLFITDPLCIVFLLVMFFYFVLLEGTVGATLGKWTCRIRVVDNLQETPSLKKSLLRNLLRAVDSLPAFNILGVVLILKSDQNARFGDRIACTRVIIR